MTVLGSAVPTHPLPEVHELRDCVVGGDAEPSTAVWVPLSRELGVVVAGAHRAWAVAKAPHLLEEWANG